MYMYIHVTTCIQTIPLNTHIHIQYMQYTCTPAVCLYIRVRQRSSIIIYNYFESGIEVWPPLLMNTFSRHKVRKDPRIVQVYVG